VLVAKTPRDTQAEMCDYLVEEESLHGNFFELKKKCTKMQIRKKFAKKLRKKQITKKCKKMRRKCEKHATQPEQQKQKAKKGKTGRKKKDSPLNCLEAPQKLQRSCLQGKICPLAKLVP